MIKYIWYPLQYPAEEGKASVGPGALRTILTLNWELDIRWFIIYQLDIGLNLNVAAATAWPGWRGSAKCQHQQPAFSCGIQPRPGPWHCAHCALVTRMQHKYCKHGSYFYTGRTCQCGSISREHGAHIQCIFKMLLNWLSVAVMVKLVMVKFE